VSYIHTYIFHVSSVKRKIYSFRNKLFKTTLCVWLLKWFNSDGANNLIRSILNIKFGFKYGTLKLAVCKYILMSSTIILSNVVLMKFNASSLSCKLISDFSPSNLDK
jgi:hypothetical protein